MRVERTDLVIIGAGLTGAAAAWRAASAGYDVTILERGEPADPRGSSHGSSRIFRYAYPSDFYTRLAVTARTHWNELERQAGCQLIEQTGCLDFGNRHAPSELAKVLARSRIDHELLSAAEATQRWPALTFDSPTLWQPHAGAIDAEVSVHHMIDLMRRAGGCLRTGWEVSGVEYTSRGLLLKGIRGERIEARRLLVAAGAWISEMLRILPLPASFVESVPKAEITQEQTHHYPFSAGDDAKVPSFIHKSDSIHLYSVRGGRDAEHRGQKVAEFKGGRTLRTPQERYDPLVTANPHKVTKYVSRTFPGLVPKPYNSATCLFTNTPNSRFVIDRCDRITLLMACSGHGAKFAPLTGMLAAQAATAPTDNKAREVVPAEFHVAAQQSSRKVPWLPMTEG